MAKFINYVFERDGMRDLVLYAHILIGIALVAIPIFIISESRKKSRLLKPLSFVAAALGWLTLLPSGKLYITFYPATKTLIKAGTMSWAHNVIMETKEHWGLLLPVIAAIAAGLVFSGKIKESRRWWALLAVLAASIGIMGMIVTSGAKYG